MVVAEALSTGQTCDERPAFGPALPADSRRRDCLSRDQTAGHLLPVLCTPRDGCHEDRRVGRGVAISFQFRWSKENSQNIQADKVDTEDFLNFSIFLLRMARSSALLGQEKLSHHRLRLMAVKPVLDIPTIACTFVLGWEEVALDPTYQSP